MALIGINKTEEIISNKLNYINRHPKQTIAPQTWHLRWLEGGGKMSPCFGWSIEKDDITIEGSTSIGVFAHAFKNAGLTIEQVCDEVDDGFIPSEKKILMGFSNEQMIIKLAK
jgi:hypothetical protein